MLCSSTPSYVGISGFMHRGADSNFSVDIHLFTFECILSAALVCCIIVHDSTLSSLMHFSHMPNRFYNEDSRLYFLSSHDDSFN